ncbi:UNVERIFIED_CONTAM: hypothetical protein K2H54_037262 [Gekko kuhli]
MALQKAITEVYWTCKAYVYIPKVKRSKLEDGVSEGIMVGYSVKYKGYRILDPSNKKTMNRAVYFDESERPQPSERAYAEVNSQIAYPAVKSPKKEE